MLSLSCQDMRDLYSITAALKDQYPDSKVSVSLTDGSILTVTVGDSAYAAASCEGQAAVSMRIASSVPGKYSGFKSLQVVSIVFGSALPIRFAPTQLSAGLTPADSTRAVESCKAWRELQ